MAAVRRPGSHILVQSLFLIVMACRVENPFWGVAGAGGSRAPEFTLPDLFGNPVSLVDHRGRTVVVDFWATWCAPCARQIPVLNAFQAAHYREVAVFGIAVDDEGVDVVARYASEHDIQYPVLVGSESLAREYGAFGYPSLFVIAPDGTIAANHVGVITEGELEEALVAAAARGAPEIP